MKAEDELLIWIYAMTNAIAAKKCSAGRAWEPTIIQAIKMVYVTRLLESQNETTVPLAATAKF